MANTGIVRRIDELGRIVIPKELRRTMRLNEGDEMEISHEGECLILHKYSAIESIMSAVKSVARILANAVDGDVLFVDTSKVLVSEGANKKRYVGAHLDDKFAKIVQSRRNEVLREGQVYGMFSDRECASNLAILEPIIACGDLVGAIVILVDREPNDAMKLHLHFCTQLVEATLSC